MSSVSVVTANYNHSAYLRSAITSVATQTVPPREMIIVDDASTDNSVDVIREMQTQYGFVKLIRNEKNIGPVSSANIAVLASTSEYIYALSADDYALPGLFEHSLNILREHPSAAFCFSDPVFVDSADGSERVNRQKLGSKAAYFSPDELVRLLRQQPYFFTGHTALIKRIYLTDSGCFPVKLEWHCDFYVLAALALKYGACYLPEPLAAMRVQSSSYSSKGMANNEAQKRVLKEMFRQCRMADIGVRRRIKKSNILSQLLGPVLTIAAGQTEHWGFITWDLVRVRTKAKVRAIAPKRALSAYRRVKRLVRRTR